MTTTDDLVMALAYAKRRLGYAREELARHQAYESADDHYARAAHDRMTRKLADDVACAECDVALLSRELARVTQESAEAPWCEGVTACALPRIFATVVIEELAGLRRISLRSLCFKKNPSPPTLVPSRACGSRSG
jgi:hypothetical protein